VHVIQPIQQFGNTVKKNATDSAMIIDAMDLLYTGRFQGFCIVSSDSDFTRLASRIREDGVTVYGFGERKTPEAFRNACDQFTYLEVLEEFDEVDEVDEDEDEDSRADDAGDQAGPVSATDAGVLAAAAATAPAAPARGRKTPARVPADKLRSDGRLVSTLRAAIDTASDDEGWARLGAVGQLMRKQQPDFDSRNWGYAKLSDLVKEIGLFAVEAAPNGIRLQNRRKGAN
jgi:hypothetical protein